VHARHPLHRTQRWASLSPVGRGPPSIRKRLSRTGRALPIDDQGDHHHLVDGHGAHSVGPMHLEKRLGMYLGTT